VRHLRGFFERAAVLEVRGAPRAAEAVIAELGGDAGRSRAPADHSVGIRLGAGGACNIPRILVNRLTSHRYPRIGLT
jgi:hypothetical protein